MRFHKLIGATALLFFALGQSGAFAQQGFFQGKTVTIIAGSAVGGGIDVYARLIGRHLSKHVPGKPTVIVQNMPGAGSLVAGRHLYTLAPKDGTHIGVVLSTALFDPLMEKQDLTAYDPRKFHYLGNAHADTAVCIVRRDAAVQDYAQLATTELVVGGTGSGSALVDYPAMERDLLGSRIKLIAGYTGSADVSLAVRRNEVQGVCGLLWSSAQQQYPEALQPGGFVKVLVQQDIKRLPQLERLGVPLVLDYARTPDQKLALDTFLSRAAVNRPFLLPPGVPAERVALMRKAFMETMTDPELLADAAKQKLGVDANSGDEAHALVQKIYATPARVLDILRGAKEPSR